MSASPPITTIELRAYALLQEPTDDVLDYARTRALIREVLDQIDETHNRVLMDGRQTVRTYSFTEAYRLVQEFRDHPAFAYSRIAILGDYERDFEKTQAVEAFSRDAGLHVRAFLDYEEAVRFLCRPLPGEADFQPSTPGASTPSEATDAADTSG